MRSLDLKRSRNPAMLDTCDIVVDVGAVYDEKKKRFDHHQRGFEEIFGHGFTTKLSSAGLIYKYASTPTVANDTNNIYRHFGKEIIAEEIKTDIEDSKVTFLWLKLYKVGIVTVLY